MTKEEKKAMENLVTVIENNPITANPFEETASWERSLDPENWEQFKPAAYRLRVTALPVGTKIPNQLEWSVDEARADRLTLIGTQGEMWNVAIDKILAKYCHLDGTPITRAELEGLLAKADGSEMDIMTIQSDDAPTVWAFQTDAKDVGTVMTDWGQLVPVNHDGDGTWLVVDDPSCIGKDGCVRTVNGDVFNITYVAV